MVLLMFVGSISHANTTEAQEVIVAYKGEACGVYAQIKNNLKPFLRVKETTYVKNADGSDFKLVTQMVPNKALYNGIFEIEQVCSGSIALTSMAQIVSPLNQIGNNIYDAQTQLVLSQVINKGLDIWPLFP